MKKKFLVSVLAIFLLVAVVAGVYLTKDLRAYKKAEQFYQAGDYLAAIEIYEAVFPYGESYDRLRLSYHELAEAARTEKEWETAIEYYQEEYHWGTDWRITDEWIAECQTEMLFETMQPLLEKYDLSSPAMTEFGYFIAGGEYAGYADAAISVVGFEALSDEEKLKFFEDLEADETIRVKPNATQIVSESHTYDAVIDEYEKSLSKDDVEILHTKLKDRPAFVQGGGSSGKCPRCNGTGVMKYYYGGSALEAAMNGYADSWYGQCGSCQGTGRAR